MHTSSSKSGMTHCRLSSAELTRSLSPPFALFSAIQATYSLCGGILPDCATHSLLMMLLASTRAATSLWAWTCLFVTRSLQHPSSTDIQLQHHNNILAELSASATPCVLHPDVSLERGHREAAKKDTGSHGSCQARSAVPHKFPVPPVRRGVPVRTKVALPSEDEKSISQRVCASHTACSSLVLFSSFTAFAAREHHVGSKFEDE